MHLSLRADDSGRVNSQKWQFMAPHTRAAARVFARGWGRVWQASGRDRLSGFAEMRRGALS